MSSGGTKAECKLEKPVGDALQELLEWSYVEQTKYFANVLQGFENLTVLIANQPPSSDEGRTVCETVNHATHLRGSPEGQ